MIGERLKELRGKRTQADVAQQIGISRARYSHYENNRNTPDIEIIKKLAQFYNVSVEYIIGIPEKKYNPYELTPREINDIEKDLDKMINNLSNNGYSHFGGEGFDEFDKETREAIVNSLRSSLIMARKLAKEKFTPKEYKKWSHIWAELKSIIKDTLCSWTQTANLHHNINTPFLKEHILIFIEEPKNQNRQR